MDKNLDYDHLTEEEFQNLGGYIDPEEEDIFIGTLSEDIKKEKEAVQRRKTVFYRDDNFETVATTDKEEAGKNEHNLSASSHVHKLTPFSRPSQSRISMNREPNEASIAEEVLSESEDSILEATPVKSFRYASASKSSKKLANNSVIAENAEDSENVGRNIIMRGAIESEHCYNFSPKVVKTPKRDRTQHILETPKREVLADKDGGYLTVFSEIAIAKAAVDEQVEGTNVPPKHFDDLPLTEEPKCSNTRKGSSLEIPQISFTAASPVIDAVSPPSVHIFNPLRKVKLVYNSPIKESLPCIYIQTTEVQEECAVVKACTPVKQVISLLTESTPVMNDAIGTVTEEVKDDSVVLPVQTPAKEGSASTVTEVTHNPVVLPVPTPPEEDLISPVKEITQDSVVLLLQTPAKEYTISPVEEINQDPVVLLLQTPAKEDLISPVEEMIQDPVVLLVQTPAKEATASHIDEIAQDPVVSPVQTPAKEDFKRPVEEITQDSVVLLVQTPAKDSTLCTDTEQVQTPAKNNTSTVLEQTNPTQLLTEGQNLIVERPTVIESCKNITPRINANNSDSFINMNESTLFNSPLSVSALEKIDIFSEDALIEFVLDEGQPGATDQKVENTDDLRENTELEESHFDLDQVNMSVNVLDENFRLSILDSNKKKKLRTPIVPNQQVNSTPVAKNTPLSTSCVKSTPTNLISFTPKTSSGKKTPNYLEDTTSSRLKCVSVDKKMTPTSAGSGRKKIDTVKTPQSDKSQVCDKNVFSDEKPKSADKNISLKLTRSTGKKLEVIPETSLKNVEELKIGESFKQPTSGKKTKLPVTSTSKLPVPKSLSKLPVFKQNKSPGMVVSVRKPLVSKSAQSPVSCYINDKSTPLRTNVNLKVEKWNVNEADATLLDMENCENQNMNNISSIIPTVDYKSAQSVKMPQESQLPRLARKFQPLTEQKKVLKHGGRLFLQTVKQPNTNSTEADPLEVSVLYSHSPNKTKTLH